MFDALTRLFAAKEPPTETITTELAVAALLVHLGSVDGGIDPVESKTIAGILEDHFDLDDAQVKKLIAEATRRDNEAVDFYQFTSALSDLDHQERIEIIRLMWQVVFADNENHELEDNMVWRVAELIGVSARERTVLRAQMRRGAEAGDFED